jgi:ankyrin repeat protein
MYCNEIELKSAFEKKDYSAIKNLIKNKKLIPNFTLFGEIAKIGQTEIFKEMLSFENINPNEDNHTFKIAAQYGNIEIIKLLLKDKRVILAEINKATILRQAAINNHFDIVELLLKSDFNPSSFKNKIIISCLNFGCDSMVSFLWENKSIKDTLESDNEKVFNEIRKKQNLLKNTKHF